MSLVGAIHQACESGSNLRWQWRERGEHEFVCGIASRTERDVLQSLYDDGAFDCCVCGGNTAHSYPASYDSVMSIAAVDNQNHHAAFSQATDQVDISAPGVAILSTVTMGEGVLADIRSSDGHYFERGAVPHNRRYIEFQPIRLTHTDLGSCRRQCKRLLLCVMCPLVATIVAICLTKYVSPSALLTKALTKGLRLSQLKLVIRLAPKRWLCSVIKRFLGYKILFTRRWWWVSFGVSDRPSPTWVRAGRESGWECDAQSHDRWGLSILQWHLYGSASCFGHCRLGMELSSPMHCSASAQSAYDHSDRSWSPR